MKDMKKTKTIQLFSMLLGLTIFIALSAPPVSAEGNKAELTPAKKAEVEKALGLDNDDADGDPYETGVKVHADPGVFEKDFILSFEQKIYTITEMEKVISQIIKPEMSDLEKYYTLAIWVNKHVQYDWDFWSGRYYFGYYSHHWDCYGGMKEDEKSICLGIAVFYADMCHAADLPCKYLRLDPRTVDHTVNYIPNINGHAYLVDVTENVFLMSEHSSSAFTDFDKEFSHITVDADNECFDYAWRSSGKLRSSTIKDYYDVPFREWFKEYALHEDPEKIFNTPYEEKGSGIDGQHYASYRDAVNKGSNRTEQPDIWFLDDFYKDSADIKAKILAGQLDEQITNVSGIKKSYDCYTPEALKEMVENEMTVEYFPSKKGDKVVAEVDTLKKGIDYNIVLDSFSKENHIAQFTLEGIGKYSGTLTFKVMLYSAVVDKVPTQIRDLKYTGTPQELIAPGQASDGEMQYALGTKNEPVGEYSTAIPTATDAGNYYVWYKAVGDATHGSSDSKRLEFPVLISKRKPEIILPDMEIKAGETVKLNPVLDIDTPVTYDYYTSDEDIIKLDGDGTVTGLAEGEAYVVVIANINPDDQSLDEPDWLYLSINVVPGTPEKTSIDNASVVLSKSKFRYNAKVQKPSVRTINGMTLKAGTDYTVTWSDPSSKNAGKYTVNIQGKGAYTGSTKATYRIYKAKNPIILKAKTVTVKKRILKKKPITVKRAKALAIKKAKGRCSYKLVSVKKGKKDFSKRFKMNAKTGKILIKKGLGKGTYRVNVKVRAAGNANYKSSSWKKVTFKIKVK